MSILTVFEYFTLGWFIFFLIVVILLVRTAIYHHASKQAHEKASQMGMVRMTKETFWAWLYRAISWRRESRLIGTIANLHIPVPLRKFVLTMYIKWTDLDMRDVEEQDLTEYGSIQELFLRKVASRARPIADVCLVSPADSYTYHFGLVDHERVIRDVKGFNYSLSAFFGDDIANKLHGMIEQKNNSALWYFIGYLSPADCHRYYSPADITLNFRRHFTGRLRSVVDELFDINERMLVTGEWKYGFFSFTAVGAIHVGEIEFDFDERHTNIKKDTVGTHDDRTYQPPVKKRKGDYFGRFLMGSVIVLVFQAPLSFKFSISKGDKLQFGQAIGNAP